MVEYIGSYLQLPKLRSKLRAHRLAPRCIATELGVAFEYTAHAFMNTDLVLQASGRTAFHSGVPPRHIIRVHRQGHVLYAVSDNHAFQYIARALKTDAGAKASRPRTSSSRHGVHYATEALNIDRSFEH